MAVYDAEFVDEFDSYAYHMGPGGGPDYGQDRDHIDYAAHYEHASARLPEDIRKFVAQFHSAINEGLVPEIQKLYEVKYPALTEEYYPKVPWPSDREVAPLVGDDPIFMTLYREMYFRHIYANFSGGPTLMHRLESYYNYCHLFNYILNTREPVSLDLPNQWLWDIVDEFLYHFQSYTINRTKIHSTNDSEMMYQEAANMWNVHSVLNVLHSVVDKSNINEQLKAYNSGGDPDKVAGVFGRQPLYKMLGYFSLVGLLRLHSVLGDYHQAVKVLENVELNKKSIYSRVPACQIMTYYHVGFAYMMMRRYADAIRTFSNILLYTQRTRQLFQANNFQNNQINKQTDQMYTLLSVCLVLHPQGIDESVQAVLKDKPYAEKMAKMQHGDLKEFENCFQNACPKFLSVAPLEYELSKPKEDHYRQAYFSQLKVFMDEVQQQLLLPTMRSFLKLYTTMPVNKLASFMEMSVDDLEANLLSFKHKMRNLVWTKGTSGLQGEFQSGSEVDFYIDDNMIHIADTKVARRYGDFFIRQIHRFDDLYRNLNNLKL